jgi:SAM-dependent methyltransferase
MAVDRLGARFESLLWNSVETQRARFKAITDVIDLTDRTILDAGCGRADFALWLREQGVAWRRYIGVDAIPEMVEHARSLSLPAAEFHQVDFIRDDTAFTCAGICPDVVIFSGSLNTIPRRQTARALERAWRDSTRALVFNFLSAGAARRLPEAPAGSAQKLPPAGVMRWALAHTPDVTLKHDYLDGRDGTVVMYKPGARMLP